MYLCANNWMRRVATWLLLGTSVLLTHSEARGQVSKVEPGPHYTLRVNGAPFFPLGWQRLGDCPANSAIDDRESVRSAIRALRTTGTNTILEPAATDGRLLPTRLHSGWYNWYNYVFVTPSGDTLRRGHPRPGAYVEALRWLLDHAYAGGTPSADPIYVLPSLAAFVKPGYQGQPYDGSEQLTCRQYARFIAEERGQHDQVNPDRARNIPLVDCSDGAPPRPFWEWNIRYLVHSLRDHPGLLGWMLWDEAEGISYRHLFGIVPPDELPRRFNGPASLPTTDLARYAYQLIVRLEQEGQPADYLRHPVVVDVASPHVYFSNRFAWSQHDDLDPAWSSGPFDITPEGTHRTPADVLGLEASARIVHTQPARAIGLDRHTWYRDPAFTSLYAAELMDVVRTDDLWGAIVIAAQAQLPSKGPFATDVALRCPPNDQQRTRLLNDRDLVWQLLTTSLEGMNGYIYYSYGLMPPSGAGAEQEARSNRLLHQFEQADLHQVFLGAPSPEDVDVASIHVLQLTDYFRTSPSFTGPADEFDPGTSPFSQSWTLNDAGQYSIANFGRSSDQDHYGQATADPYAVVFGDHRLLRTAFYHESGASFLVVSNVYDARLEARLRIHLRDMNTMLPALAEGQFDLGSRGRFTWQDRPQRVAQYRSEPQGASLTISLEPYEARIFRLSQ